ncbi:hypothetical protein V6N13_075657 [Hibiscus sabdariffa]|uniref:Uncharacterized protein n=1 Tax=Hibiscus sabdariffa TaxID=183260 RepID=A0ABR2UCA9_9ROSI
MIADSRKRQNANSRRQSDTAHLAALPETPTESETFQSPYRIGPLKHYFYDLRSTPTPDTDSFTPTTAEADSEVESVLSYLFLLCNRYLLPLMLTT